MLSVLRGSCEQNRNSITVCRHGDSAAANDADKFRQKNSGRQREDRSKKRGRFFRQVRRASLRGQIHTELSAPELAKVAQQEGISVEELKKEEDFDPYLNLKVVLVEEGGQLKVGYFEFLPPSMLD